MDWRNKLSKSLSSDRIKIRSLSLVRWHLILWKDQAEAVVTIISVHRLPIRIENWNHHLGHHQRIEKIHHQSSLIVLHAVILVFVRVLLHRLLLTYHKFFFFLDHLKLHKHLQSLKIWFWLLQGHLDFYLDDILSQVFWKTF